MVELVVCSEVPEAAWPDECARSTNGRCRDVVPAGIDPLSDAGRSRCTMTGRGRWQGEGGGAIASPPHLIAPHLIARAGISMQRLAQEATTQDHSERLGPLAHDSGRARGRTMAVVDVVGAVHRHEAERHE